MLNKNYKLWCTCIAHCVLELSIKHYCGYQSVRIVIFYVWSNLGFLRYYEQHWKKFLEAFMAQKKTLFWAKAFCRPYPLVCPSLMSSLRASIKGDCSQTSIENKGQGSLYCSTVYYAEVQEQWTRYHWNSAQHTKMQIK